MDGHRVAAVASVTRWVLAHKRVVSGAWMMVAVISLLAIGPAGRALSDEFAVPGREGFETNRQIASTYGTGGDVAPIVPVVTLPQETTVDSPGVTQELEAALARVKAALPDARIASYGSTGDDAFVSQDRRTTFALVYIPQRGGLEPGQKEAQQAQAALHGVTVGGSPVEVTGLEALRASAAGECRGECQPDAGGGGRGPGCSSHTRLCVRLGDGDRAAGDGDGGDTDNVLAGVASCNGHGRVRGDPVPGGADRTGDCNRLCVADRDALARGEWAGWCPNEVAVQRAMEHAGSAVVFSGTTVAIALLALVALPVPFLRSIGIAGM